MKHLLIAFAFILALCFLQPLQAQTFYGSSAAYGLRKLVPSYSGKAIQIRRTCDNATVDIGFSSCGDLDITTLTEFVVASNPLSAISSATDAAYSLRLLRCAYAGKCINVRRSSDNSTQDIPFTANGDLDTTILKTFVGASTGYVTKWYNQSAVAGRDASQATTANQPRIVNAGVIDRVNGMPAIYFNGSTYLATASFTVYNGATKKASFNGVAKVNSDMAGGYNCIVSKTGTGGNTNQPSPLDFYYNVGTGNNTVFVGNGVSNNGGSTFGGTKFNAASGTMQVWTFESSSTANTTNAYCNSTQVVTNASSTNYGDVSSPLYIGRRADGVTSLNGWIPEVITFNTLPSSTDRAYLEWSQGQYYNISGMPALGTLPASPANAYIAKWYDQSGNGNDAVQATTGNQPRIVNAGVIDLQNSLASIHFDGASEFLTAGAFTTAFNNTVGGTLNTLGVNNGGASWQGLAQQGRNSSPWWGIWGSNTAKWTAGFSNGPANMISAINSSVLQTTSLIQLAGTSTALYGNGSSISSSATTANSSNAQSFYIGYAATGTEYWNGYASEVSVFSSGMNTTRRVLMESNQAAYYTLGVAGTKYTVASGYNLFVTGVGRTNSADSVADTRQSAGLGFIVGNAGTDFLQDDGDYMTAGMACPTATVSQTLLPATVTERWSNDWYLNKTDAAPNHGNIRIYFDFSDYGVGGTPGTASNYVLLGRNSTAATFSIVPTTGVSVSGDRVLFTLPVTNLATTGYYTIGSLDYIDSNLPIELLSFNATPQEEKVNLNWTTTTETNNKFFTIERSQDGIQFSELKNVASKAPGGNSLVQLSYTDCDDNPFSGTSYYRLKQTDYNGAWKSFTIVSVTFDKSGQVVFTVYPNPNQGQFMVDFGGLENDHLVDVYLHDVRGKEVYHNTFATQTANGSLSINPVQKIGAGIYSCTLYLEEVKYQFKIVVE